MDETITGYIIFSHFSGKQIQIGISKDLKLKKVKNFCQIYWFKYRFFRGKKISNFEFYVSRFYSDSDPHRRKSLDPDPQNFHADPCVHVKSGQLYFENPRIYRISQPIVL